MKKDSPGPSSNEELLRTFFDSAAEAAWLLDREGVIVLSNRSASLLLCGQKNSGVGFPLTGFIEDRQSPSQMGDFDDAFDFKKLLVNGLLRNVFSYLATGNDDLVPILVSTQMVENSILVIAQNLSEVLKMEHRLVETRKELAAAGFKATSTLTAGFAHEINNPLTVVIGRLRQTEYELQANGAGSKNLPKMVSGAIVDADRVSSLVDQLRTAYGDTGEELRSLFTVRKLIDIAVGRSVNAISAGKIKMIIECNAVLAVFCTASVSNVIGNVVSNAVQWCDKKGNPYIAIDTRLRRDYVSIIIRNNGSAIPEHVATKVFEPFFTTQEVGSGVGLGLAVARCICEQHGGTIELVESGNHTTFEIKLPTRKMGS